MALKDLLKKLAASQAKEVDEPLKILERMKRQAEAARKVSEEIKTQKA